MSGLDLATLQPDPIVQFSLWLAEAMEAEVSEPTAMTLATADAGGVVSARMVLLKGVGPEGFQFFTNQRSAKARDLESNPHAALVFHWQPLRRQVRVVGTVTRLDEAANDAYFATRPRGAQLGAWASAQSDPLADRAELERRVTELDARYAGTAVPRPPHWGGYLVTPAQLEFWQGRPDRLHDRFRYTRAGDGWRVQRLAP